MSDINDKNVITELEEGKKYLIRVKILKSCSINIIRNYNINKINFLGEKKDENINYCKSVLKLLISNFILSFFCIFITKSYSFKLSDFSEIIF